MTMMEGPRNGSRLLSSAGRRVVLRLDDGSIIASQQKLYGEGAAGAVRVSVDQAVQLGRAGEPEITRLKSLIAQANGQTALQPVKAAPSVVDLADDVPSKKPRLTSAPASSTKSQSSGGVSALGWVEKCKELLETVLNHLKSQPQGDLLKNTFYHPVDKTIVKDYHKIIKQPMWLQRIEQKLSSKGGYAGPHDFYRDMKLVWSNCATYNKKTYYGDVGAAADATFEQAWATSGLAEDGTRSKRATAGVAPPKFAPDAFENQSKRVSSKSQRSGKKGGVGDRSVSHEVTSGQHKSAHSSLVSSERMQEIALELGNLSDASLLEEAMRLVPQQFLMTDDSGEIELDFENLDQETLQKLNRFLKSVNNQQPQQPAQQPSRSTRAPRSSSSSSSDDTESSYD